MRRAPRRPRLPWPALAALALSAALAPSSARAHGMRVALLEISETDARSGAALAIFQSPSADPRVRAVLPCPAPEEPQDGPQEEPQEALPLAGPGTPHRGTYTLRCGAPLAGREVSVEGLGSAVTEAVVRVVLADGTVHARVLTAAAPRFAIPARADGWAVFRQYLGWGARHIAGGADHLLFLLGLALLLRRPRLVLLAETAFTLSHTVSLSATALGYVHLSPRAAEAAIALSLVLLALDLSRRATFAPRPLGVAALAFGFGLVHGLGFAGGLAELGLPDGAVASALLGFGAGVELGQVAFLLLLLVLSRALAALPARWAAIDWSRPGSLAIGSLGAAWLIERLLVALA